MNQEIKAPQPITDQFLVVRKWKADGQIVFVGPLTGDELEQYGQRLNHVAEVYAVPLLDVLALAGVHEDSGPARLLQPMTVDIMAAQIMGALYVQSNDLTVPNCADWAYDGAQALIAEAMRRDAMGVPLEQDTDKGETDAENEKGERESDGSGEEAGRTGEAG